MIPWGMEDGDEVRQSFKGGRDPSTSTVSKSGSKRESSRTLSIGNCGGSSGTIAPFEDWVRTLKGSDFECDLLDWVKTNVRITWDRWNQMERSELTTQPNGQKGREIHRWLE